MEVTAHKYLGSVNIQLCNIGLGDADGIFPHDTLQASKKCTNASKTMTEERETNSKPEQAG